MCDEVRSGYDLASARCVHGGIEVLPTSLCSFLTSRVRLTRPTWRWPWIFSFHCTCWRLLKLIYSLQNYTRIYTGANLSLSLSVNQQPVSLQHNLQQCQKGNDPDVVCTPQVIPKGRDCDIPISSPSSLNHHICKGWILMWLWHCLHGEEVVSNQW